MASKRNVVHRTRTSALCRLCHRPIPHNTVATVTTEKNAKGEHVSEYVCYRCANPYNGRTNRT